MGNGIKTRPLPLSENGLKGLVDGQPQGPPEARGGGPGRGGAWLGNGAKPEKENSIPLCGLQIPSLWQAGRWRPWLFTEADPPSDRGAGPVRKGYGGGAGAQAPGAALRAGPFKDPFPTNSNPGCSRLGALGDDTIIPGSSRFAQVFRLAPPAPRSPQDMPVKQRADRARGMYLPSASSILGMSRYFSATSKALFRLVTGSSWGREAREGGETWSGAGRTSRGNKSWPRRVGSWGELELEMFLQAVLSHLRCAGSWGHGGHTWIKERCWKFLGG